MPEPVAAAASTRGTSGPADLLRERLTSGRGRLAVIAATTGVWVMDLLLVHHLEKRRLLTPALAGLVHRIDLIGTAAFIAVTLGLTVSLFRVAPGSCSAGPWPICCFRCCR